MKRAYIKVIPIITKDEIYRRARNFQIGDCVIVEDENGEPAKAVLERFYPHLVQFKREDGRTFTADYLKVSKARLIQSSEFQIHDDNMDRQALLKGLGKKKVGEKHDKV